MWLRLVWGKGVSVVHEGNMALWQGGAVASAWDWATWGFILCARF